MKDAIFRKIILYEAEHINPEISNNTRELLLQRFTSDSHPALWRMYKRRHIIISIIAVFLLFCIAMSMSSLIEIINAASIKNIKSLDKNTVTLPLNQSIPQKKNSADSLPKTTLRHGEYISRQFPNYLNKQIWLVEKTSDREIYSNRLQIITTYTVENIPRRYYRFSKNSSQLPAKDQITNKITGILFHSSESDISPFKPEMNKSIKEKSMLLIRYIMNR